MEEEKNKQQTGVGVGALVTAIIAFLMAVIPCVGVVAIVPAVIAVILAIIGLSRPMGNQGLLIGGLVVGIISIMIATSQVFVLGKIADKSDDWGKEIEKVVKDVTDDIEAEFGDKEIVVHVDDGDEKVEIKASVKRDDLQNKLDQLEGTGDTTETGDKPAEPVKPTEPGK